MIASFFNTVFYTPLYNGLVALVALVPGGDVGLAIILLTVLVRLVLLPISLKAARTQRIVKKIEPLVEELKKKFKDNQEEQMRQIMALYKKHGFNPFLNFLFILIQLPIIFALYFVFFKGGLPDIHKDLLYAPVRALTENPNFDVSILFLGFLDVTKKNIFLAIFAGITQFLLFRMTLPAAKPLGKNPTMKEELMRNLSLQMRYIFPVMVAGIAYVISAAIALYWVVSNIVSIGQEYYVRRRLDHEEKAALLKEQNNEQRSDKKAN